MNNDELLPKYGRDSNIDGQNQISNEDKNGDHQPNGNNNIVRERRRKNRRDRILLDGGVGLFQESDNNNIPGI